MKYPLSLLGILILFAAACKKNPSADGTPPEIAITEPVSGDTVKLSNGDEVHVELTVTDDAGLHALKVTLRDASGNTLIDDAPLVNDLKVYPYHTHLTPSLAANNLCTLTVQAEDHAGHTASEQRVFLLMP